MPRKRRHTRRISKQVKDAFGLPFARKFKLPKKDKGNGRVNAVVSGLEHVNHGSTHIVVLTQADLIGPSEVSYYTKRAADIARRWFKKAFNNRNRVSVELVTLFAKLDQEDYQGVDDVTVGQRYVTPGDDDIPDVGEEWEFRNMFRSPPQSSVDKVRRALRILLSNASAKTGWQENDLDFLGTFIMTIRVRKWTLA